VPEREFPRCGRQRGGTADRHASGRGPRARHRRGAADRSARHRLSLAALSSRSARSSPDTETAVVGSGRVSVTPLHFDRTAARTFATLENALAAGA
jgi:broad specificity polyphosphatase/5'/3'-nucleotidase SurE